MNTMHNLLAFYNNSDEDDIYHITMGKILQNWDRIEGATIYNICDMCSVSTATISRLTKKLGYKNFTEFRQDLASVWNKFGYYNRVLPSSMCQSPDLAVTSYIGIMLQMMEGLRDVVDVAKVHQIVDALHTAKKVRFYSFGRYFAEASLQINLIKDGKDALILVRYADQLKDVETLDADSLAVIFAVESLDSMDMELICRKAHECKAKILLVTTSQNVPFIKYADFLICSKITSINTMINSYSTNIYLDMVSIFYRTKYLDKLWDGPEISDTSKSKKRIKSNLA